MRTAVIAVAGVIGYVLIGLAASAFVSPVGPGSDWIVYAILSFCAAAWTLIAIMARSRSLGVLGLALTVLSLLGYAHSASHLARTIDRNQAIAALKSQGVDPGPVQDAWSKGDIGR
jgi:ABC-type dipeptide/oligopeptide/nickel transport system permease subunit